MDDFSDVANARASYKAFADALKAGREIIQRTGVSDPPPIPDFDSVFRRLTPEAKQELYGQLRNAEIPPKPADAIRLWQPFIRRAFGQGGRPV
jgi:hypothetical protein